MTEHISLHIILLQRLKRREYIKGKKGPLIKTIFLGAWFNEDGSPKAVFPPKKLWNLLYNEVEYTHLKYFDFINGEDVTLDEVKRRGKDEHWYAIVLLNIQKQEDDYGNIYFEGIDPISGQVVVVKGSFDNILNGDSVLAFGSSMGLASDDTLNIKGVYLEIITERLKGIF